MGAAESKSPNEMSNTISANGHVHDAAARLRKSSFQPPPSPNPTFKSLPTSWSDPNFRYSSALANDNIVIVETTSNSSVNGVPTEPCTPPATNEVQPTSVTRRRLEYSMSVQVASSTSGTRSDRAGATLRSLSDAELPQPDTVRKAKDVFETMARKHDAPSSLHQANVSPALVHSSPTGTINKTTLAHALARSQSVLVLTGRAWCNGNNAAAHLTPNLTFQHQHQHGACSDAVRGARHAAYFRGDDPSNKGPENPSHHPATYNYYQPGNSQTLPLPSKNKTGRPQYKRSCSDLDRFFSRQNGYDLGDGDETAEDESTDDEEPVDDEWGRHMHHSRHESPVSPEAIRAIREQGTCVTFFGGQAYAEPQVDEEHHAEDDSFAEGSSYMLDYPYELYNATGSPSPEVTSPPVIANGHRNRPRIIGMVPKFGSSVTGNRDGSYCSSVASSSTGGSSSESVSPAPPTNLNALSPTSAWFLGGLNNSSLDDLRLSLHPVHADGQLDDYGERYPVSGSGYIRLQNGNHDGDNRLIRNARHGQWMKNPYWQGSYYVIFDFTDKDVRPNVDVC